MSRLDSPPLIVHLVYRFATGGLENGLINLVNSLPRELARHRIVALCDIDRQFADQITTENCQYECLGADTSQQTLRQLPNVYRRLRELKPAIVHTRNISTLECQVAAWAARIPCRVHGEHGWDQADLYGSNTRYTQLRKLIRRFVHRQVALSTRTAKYLEGTIGVPKFAIREIHNGVDTSRFSNRANQVSLTTPSDWPFAAEHFVVGTVGRLSSIKNQSLLCRAFGALLQQNPEFREQARLVIVGDGPDKAKLIKILDELNVLNFVWFAGDRRDVPALLQKMSVFCLPSKAEGLSNSILEAMSSSLPVVATEVGGNSEQIEDGVSGTIVSNEDQSGLETAILRYFRDSATRAKHGRAARDRVEANFSLPKMVHDYGCLYSELLNERAKQLSRVYQEQGSE